MNSELARARVSCVVRIARRIQDPLDILGKEARERLPEVTGLARESIELALQEHFETQPTDAEIEKLLSTTAFAPVCHVVISANVFTAPLRALALAVATSERVCVRPSRRDPVITELLVRALQDDSAFEGEVQIVETIHAHSGDELHIYGSDETIAAMMASLSAGIVVRGHGTGIGIALVTGESDFAASAEGLAQDISVFDQRGCLSPRFVFVQGDEFVADTFCTTLHQALRNFSTRYPRGTLDSGLRGEISQYRATMESIGSFWEGPSHAIGFDPSPKALVLPPAARIVHIVSGNENNIPRLLERWIRHVTVVGIDAENSLSRKMKEWIPRARFGSFGQMQKPPLDGPVDGRTTPLRTSGLL